MGHPRIQSTNPKGGCSYEVGWVPRPLPTPPPPPPLRHLYLWIPILDVIQYTPPPFSQTEIIYSWTSICQMVSKLPIRLKFALQLFCKYEQNNFK